MGCCMRSGFRSYSRSLFLVFAAALLAFSAACSRPRTDAQIIGDVVTGIQTNPQISKKNVAVNSQNGVVTLNGTVPNDAERNAAASVAAQVPGVRTVINDLFIDGPATTEAQQQASIADAQQTPEATTEEEPAAVPAKSERSSKPSAYHERTATKTAAKTTPSKPAVTPSSSTTAQSNLPIVIENAPAAQSPSAQSNVASVPALPSIPSTPAVKPVQL